MPNPGHVHHMYSHVHVRTCIYNNVVVCSLSVLIVVVREPEIEMVM